MADADGFLLGRKTYDIFSNYWPKVTDPDNPIATALNLRPKYVVSRTLEQVAWNASIIAAIVGRRRSSGRTINAWKKFVRFC